MVKCDKCGQEIKVKSNRRKTRDIWKSINELLGIDWNGEDIISDCYRQKELIKLESAIKKKLEELGMNKTFKKTWEI